MLAIFISACVAAYEAIVRIINPDAPDHLLALALAGAIGFLGNMAAAFIRTRAGRRLDSPALVADGTTLAPTPTSVSGSFSVRR